MSNAAFAETLSRRNVPEFRVLVIEDDPQDVELLRLALEESSIAYFEIADANSVRQAVQLSRHTEFHAVITDLALGDTDGIETVGHATRAFADLPLLVLSGDSDDGIALECIAAGAHEYLLKREISGLLLARLLVASITRNRHIRSLQAAKQLSDYRATHDPLTDLPNRAYFFEALDEAMCYARRYQQSLAVLFMDLNNFKAINDQFGHDSGDQVLTEVSNRLIAALRNSDTIARHGGDEFTCILCNLGLPREAGAIAKNLAAKICAPIQIGDATVSVGVSVGVAIYPADADDGKELLRKADSAMYRAKNLKQTFQFYSPGFGLNVILDYLHDYSRPGTDKVQ